MNSTATTAQIEEDPRKYFWFTVYLLIMAVSALPLFGLRIPLVTPYIPTLIVHEFAAFGFVGHTFFSNIWSLRIRKNMPLEFGVWARSHMRILCLSITGPMAFITPFTGLMVVERWGGLAGAPWAWDAYLAFWLMCAISVVPDVIRYARNRHADEPMHGMLSGGLRAMIALVLTIYILITMIAKVSLTGGISG
ncbi:MAG: hypothetical protein QNJ73_12690 [Gammaproteobacteria bacterium]|nr:hypothetical protein [Gammaproteobacteria bacterium]